MSVEQPKISCLCVTENRDAFMPWLLWNFDRQTYENRELLIVDSSLLPRPVEHPRVRWLSLPPGANVPTKRNVALRAADGEYIAWFDDDDWQHPERLERLERQLTQNAGVYAGGSRSYFIDIHSRRARFYDGCGHLIFNGALFRREQVAPIAFNEQRYRASDTCWLGELAERWHPRVDEQAILSLWLSHETNISNPRHKRRFGEPLDVLKELVGAELWGETEERLQELCQRLPPPEWESRTQRVVPLQSETAVRARARARRGPVGREWSVRELSIDETTEIRRMRPTRPNLGKVNGPAQLESQELRKARFEMDVWVIADPAPEEESQAWREALLQSSGCRVRAWGVGRESWSPGGEWDSAASEWALVSWGWSFVFPPEAEWIATAQTAVQRGQAELVGCFPGPPLGRVGSELSARAALGAAAYWDRSASLFRRADQVTLLWLARREWVQSWLRASQDVGMRLDDSWQSRLSSTSRGWLRPQEGWALSTGWQLQNPALQKGGELYSRRGVALGQ